MTWRRRILPINTSPASARVGEMWRPAAKPGGKNLIAELRRREWAQARSTGRYMPRYMHISDLRGMSNDDEGEFNEWIYGIYMHETYVCLPKQNLETKISAWQNPISDFNTVMHSSWLLFSLFMVIQGVLGQCVQNWMFFNIWVRRFCYNCSS